MKPAFNRTIWQTLQEAMEPHVGGKQAGELASVLLPVVTNGEQTLTACGNRACTGCRICGVPTLGIPPRLTSDN